MQGKVEIAGVNTAKLKVLKNDETMELLRRSKSGDQDARQQLIEGNLRLVLSVIQRCCWQTDDSVFRGKKDSG